MFPSVTKPTALPQPYPTPCLQLLAFRSWITYSEAKGGEVWGEWEDHFLVQEEVSTSAAARGRRVRKVPCPQVRVLSLLRMWFLEASPHFVVGCPLNVFLCTCGSYHCSLAGQTATYCVNCRILFLDNRPKGSYVSIYIHFQGKPIWPSG